MIDKDKNQNFEQQDNAMISQDLIKQIKIKMAEKSLSLRKLSTMTGISTASVSRLLSAKQKPNINHLKKLSACLDIPIEKMLIMTGTQVTAFDGNTIFLITLIREMLEGANVDINNLMSSIKYELKKYQQFACTVEGKRIIDTRCHEKISRIDGSGLTVDQLRRLYDIYTDRQTPQKVKDIAAGGLLYFVLAPDVIPDHLFPIGYLDDAIAVKLTMDLLNKSAH